MIKIVKGVLAGFAATALALTWTSGAQAAGITIGLQEAGYGSPTGSITPVVSGIGNVATGVGITSYGTFTINNISALGDPLVSSPNFFTNSLNTSTSAPGTLNVFITEQYLTMPIGPLNLQSSFTENTLPSGFTVTESVFLDNNNGLFSMADLVASAMFTSTGISIKTTPVVIAPTTVDGYSITVEYTIDATGAGTSNATINVTDVPEPVSLTLLGAGLVGLGLTRRWKRAA